MAEELSPEQQEAERRGDPYLHWRDAHDHVRVLSLDDSWQQITIGRGPSADVGLPWDEDVSRVHAELVRIGDDWAVVDDGRRSARFPAPPPGWRWRPSAARR